MALSTCPHCKKTLKVPDDSTPRALRCPLCKKIFEHTGANGDGRQTLDGRRSAFSAALSKSGEVPAGSNGNRGTHTTTLSTGTSTILSDADEAMLREFGSGSGLLELTREAYTNGNPSDVNVQVTLPANAPRHATAVSPPAPTQAPAQAPAQAPVHAPAAPQPSAGGHPDMGSPEFERQFSVVSMALTMANKLVLAHKAELTNVRSNQRLAWTAVVVLAILFVGTAYWGLNHRHDADTTRAQLAQAHEVITADKDRSATQEKDLTKVKSTLELTTDQLRASQGEQVTLSNSLRSAEDRARSLETDLRKAKSDLEQAKVAQDRAERDVTVLDKEIKTLRAELAGKTPETKPE